jgi:hypothetical protein
MPRTHRFAPDGTVHHIIARFVGKEPFFDIEGARAEYLRRLGCTLARHDASVFAFNLMSTHLHLALLKRCMSLSALFAGLHGGFAWWVNLQLVRPGHVFAQRFKNVLFDEDLTAILGAYIHNNAVRAGVVGAARDCTWSSHRFYLGLAKPPAWLDVELGLALSGYDPGARARDAFDAFVNARAGDGRIPEFSGAVSEVSVRERCAALPGGAQLRSPRVTIDLDFSPALPVVGPPRFVWSGTTADAARIAAGLIGLDVDVLRSTARTRDVTGLRSALLLAWTDGLGRRQCEMARYLGMNLATASAAVHRARGRAEPVAVAETIVARCRDAALGADVGRARAGRTPRADAIGAPTPEC